jgi:hypothetical protein
MFMVGLIISGLALRVRRHELEARKREERTAALYALSQDLSKAEDEHDAAGLFARRGKETFTRTSRSSSSTPRTNWPFAAPAPSTDRACAIVPERGTLIRAPDSATASVPDAMDGASAREIVFGARGDRAAYAALPSARNVHDAHLTSLRRL